MDNTHDRPSSEPPLQGKALPSLKIKYVTNHGPISPITYIYYLVWYSKATTKYRHMTWQHPPVRLMLSWQAHLQGIGYCTGDLYSLVAILFRRQLASHSLVKAFVEGVLHISPLVTL